MILDGEHERDHESTVEKTDLNSTNFVSGSSTPYRYHRVQVDNHKNQTTSKLSGIGLYTSSAVAANLRAGADVILNTMFKFNQLNEQDVIDNNLTDKEQENNVASIGNVLGFPNIIKKDMLTTGLTLTGEEAAETTAKSIPNLLVEIPELNTRCYNSTTQNVNNAIGFIPRQQLISHDETNSLYYEPQNENKLTIKTSSVKKMNNMSVKISTMTGERIQDLISSPVNVVCKITSKDD